MSATQVTQSPTTVRLRRTTQDEPPKSLVLSPKSERLNAPLKREAAAMPKSETWGRHNSPSAFTLLATVGIMVFCPIMVMVFHLACVSYQGSLPSLAASFLNNPSAVMHELFPPVSMKGVMVGLVWTALQIALWYAVPAPDGEGSRTPAGNVLKYPMNGMRIFVVNHVLFAACVALGLFKGSILYDHRGDLLVLANIYGIALAAFCYAKAHMNPTHPEDRKFSGNFIYGTICAIAAIKCTHPRSQTSTWASSSTPASAPSTSSSSTTSASASSCGAS